MPEPSVLAMTNSRGLRRRLVPPAWRNNSTPDVGSAVMLSAASMPAANRSKTSSSSASPVTMRGILDACAMGLGLALLGLAVEERRQVPGLVGERAVVDVHGLLPHAIGPHQLVPRLGPVRERELLGVLLLAVER